MKSSKAPRWLRYGIYIFWYTLLAFLLWAMVMDYQDLNLLAQAGRITDARVTSKRVHHGKSTSYHLDYSFQMNGRTLNSAESVFEAMYRRYVQGSQLTITYLPANPALTRIGKVDLAKVEDAKRTGILIVSFLAILFTTMTWYIERCCRR